MAKNKTVVMKQPFSIRFKRDMRRNYSLYILLSVVLAFYFLFHYKPMYGAIIAFQDYRPALGIWNSEWVGLRHFIRFLKDLLHRA